MQIHWWIVAGWSEDASRSFRELPAAEAALRAGKELADLTSLPAGSVNSKGLLDLRNDNGTARRLEKRRAQHNDGSEHR